MTDIDLGNLHLIVDRPGATPAPWPATADTDVTANRDWPPLPSRDPHCFPVCEDPGLHRYAPNADRPTLNALTVDTDALIAASRQTRADLARARGTDIDEQGRAA